MRENKNEMKDLSKNSFRYVVTTTLFFAFIAFFPIQFDLTPKSDLLGALKSAATSGWFFISCLFAFFIVWLLSSLSEFFKNLLIEAAGALKGLYISFSSFYLASLAYLLLNEPQIEYKLIFILILGIFALMWASYIIICFIDLVLSVNKLYKQICFIVLLGAISFHISIVKYALDIIWPVSN